jgi:hypothetical protein
VSPKRWSHLAKWFGLGAHWRGRHLSAPCIRYGEKKQKIYFDFFALEMGSMGFWTCFDDFFLSRSANPVMTHV